MRPALQTRHPTVTRGGVRGASKGRDPGRDRGVGGVIRLAGGVIGHGARDLGVIQNLAGANSRCYTGRAYMRAGEQD